MKIGLALSGGAIRGIAHAGAIKALEENGIKITAIAGTSSGSIVSALYAMGYSPNGIHTLFKRYAKKVLQIDRHIIWKEAKSYLLKKKIEDNGLKSGKELEELYNTLALQKHFKKITDIKMPLFITATDILNETSYICSSVKRNDDTYINNISIGEAVRASSTFPMLYKPFKFKNHIFLDGGILDNVPAKVLKDNGVKKILSINFDEYETDENSPALNLLTKVLDLMCNKIAKESINYSDYLLTVPTDTLGMLDIDKIDYGFNLGYETAMKKMSEIKEKLL